MLNVNNIANRDDLLILFDDLEEDDEFTITLTHMDRNYLTNNEFDDILDDMKDYADLNGYELEVEYENSLHLTLFKFTKED